MEEQDSFLTIKQVAKLYGWPIGGLRGLLFRRSSNGLESAIISIGRKILIHRSAFEEWLLKHRNRAHPSKLDHSNRKRRSGRYK